MAVKQKFELVFIPSPGVGHIYSTIEVAKLLTDRNDQLSVTVLIMRMPYDKKPISQSPLPRVSFIELRKEEVSPRKVNSFLSFFDFIDSHKAHVREILAGIRTSDSSDLAGIVVDMFCTSMFDVANEFGAPSYVFYTSGAAMLGLTLHLQSLRDDSNVDVTEYKNSSDEIAVPAYSIPVPFKILPSITFDKEGGCDVFLDQSKATRGAKAIIVNTFKELESHAIQALSEDESIPPVYTIGPIVKLNGSTDPESQVIIKWLDLHPDSSVVFLCFGSMGSFGEDQVKEIAVALEHSGCRFLWSLRKPQPKGTYEPPSNYENPAEVLPEGFLERTAEVGKVIGWAPQAAVLSHPAVGGFVTHCGWNSILESVWCGVAMATWPLYAEQQLNAFLLVKNLGLAAEIKMDYRKEVMRKDDVEIVSAEVIENGIKQVMDPGNEIKKMMKEMKEKSRVALSDGGSSSASLSCFLNLVKDNVVH